MKSLIAGVVFLAVAVSGFAQTRGELDGRIYKLINKFEAIQHKELKNIPSEYLRKAEGIVLMDRTKAGFIFGYQGGGGVALVRDPVTREWSAPAFVEANEASLGFQIGGQQSFVVILMMTTNATQLLTDHKFEFGAEARGTAGNNTRGEEENFSEIAPVLMFTDRKGLYGGATVKGGAMSPSDEDNRKYYGWSYSLREIVFDRKAKPTEAGKQLIAKIEELSKETAPAPDTAEKTPPPVAPK